MTQVKTLPATKTTNTKTNDAAKASALPAANVTEQVKATEQGKKPESENTEAKVTRVYDLYETVQRREAFQRSYQELKSFKIGSASMRCSLYIVDDSGKKFETSNSNAISLLVSNLLQILEQKIAETEAQIVL
jgi:hypothetical protein